MEEIEFTEAEKELLTLLFKIGDLIIETQDGYFDLRCKPYFDRNDFFSLAEKLGIDY